MSLPSPIPPPNDRRNSRASSNGGLPNNAGMVSSPSASFEVGGPPDSPSPLALRASNSQRRKSQIVKIPPEFQALEYVSEPNSNLVCLICHTPYDRPAQLSCQHTFCRECLDHAWAPPAIRRTCPTCRRLVETEADIGSVPISIKNMLDELEVKCPNSRAGCKWAAQRVNVHDHVMLYCEHTPIECPAPNCRLPISQKHINKACQHYTLSCEDCHTSLMKRDLEEHQREICAHRVISCSQCSASVLRLDLKTHINTDCPKHIVSCQGSIVGCKVRAERAEVVLHEVNCTMATMAPHFREQQARIERNEARMEPLARKVGILEDGLSSITNMLYPANGNDSSFPVTDPLDPNDTDNTFSVSTPDFRLPPASFPPAAQSSDSTPAQPPFDSQVHHLLTLHDSLREEVTRIANTLTEVEGRTSMMVYNESQRSKDELLHANAAINSMRMQVHWLMSAHLHQRSNSATTGAFFTTYERTKSLFTRLNTTSTHPHGLLPTPVIHAAASSLAELVSCAILTPAEVIKQNAQMVSAGEAQNATMHTLRKFQSNPLALWRGYTALAGRNLPFTAMQFPMFERLKVGIREWRDARGKTTGTIWESACITAVSAGSAGAVAAVITTPVDVVKTRVMLSAGDEAPARKPAQKSGGVVDALGNSVRAERQSRKSGWMVGREILKEQGVKGLWRGGALRAVWTFVGSGLYLGAYESGRVYLAARRGEHVDEKDLL
ncbi:mitochondrial carrier [Dothidotthia symphoricarpi CBS 119687]|uniref:Mitochondrial carrier n=1 Tax=Dothidotthia symphoricarpi CBS 119687 TaxID=1392245 RepID=A0A6A6AIC9_9PLEO|nr:mitochondrial carrier [Dothidotthia symphoricarpi CBS 119687]KAF2131722.1 mitochondrial carrier [Dothidotthia symphoricarpi CBS 119687]